MKYVELVPEAKSPHAQLLDEQWLMDRNISEAQVKMMQALVLNA